MPDTISAAQMDRHKKQQDRLNSKLNERLGYSEVYFKRDSQLFFNKLPILEQQRLLDRLKLIYSKILFEYFSSEDTINDLIDRFVEEAFFVNLPLNKVVEIHINLIEKLERQLKLEGMNTEYLSDFRLTLIDILAHLGEMYRSAVTKC